jgi:hypothetical protein
MKLSEVGLTFSVVSARSQQHRQGWLSRLDSGASTAAAFIKPFLTLIFTARRLADGLDSTVTSARGSTCCGFMSDAAEWVGESQMSYQTL